MLGYYPVFESAMKDRFIDDTMPSLLQSIEECKEKIRQYEANLELSAHKKNQIPATPSLASLLSENEYEHSANEAGDEENEYDSGDSFIAEDEEDDDSMVMKATPKKKSKRRKEQEVQVINELQKPNIPGNKSLDKSPIFLYSDVRHLLTSGHPRVLQRDQFLIRRICTFCKPSQRGDC